MVFVSCHLGVVRRGVTLLLMGTLLSYLLAQKTGFSNKLNIASTRMVS